MTRSSIRTSLLALCAAAVCTVASAKLPAPSPEAAAKAAEAAAKTAHGNKLAEYQLCRSMEKVVARYRAEATKAGKTLGKPADTPACADPGPYVPPAAAPAPAPAAKS